MSHRAICLTLLAEPSTSAEQGTVSGFRGVAYSGGVVPNHGWSGDMAIDLSSLSLPDTYVPVLRNHDPDQIVGRARLSNDGQQLSIVDGVFSSVTEVSRETSALMAEGHPWKLSIGINANMQTADRGKPVELNGRSMALDSIMRNARVLELSFVPSGADPSAYAAQLSTRHGIQPPTTGDSMSDVNPLQARVTELEAQVATLTAERDSARADLNTATVSLAAAATARRNERITALFGAEAELTDEQRTAYVSMTDGQFAAVETALTAARGQGDPSLFRQTATHGRDHEGGASVSTYVPPAGYGVDSERAQLHAKALKHQAEHPGTDYLTAIAAVA